MALKVAEEWLNACSGCEISMIDLGERLFSLFDRVDFVHMPVLMDHKYYGRLGDGRQMDLPEADVGIITGGLYNREHLEVAREMRRKCGIIVGLGTCATHGGIPALANSYHGREILERYYSTETTDRTDFLPSEGIPELLEECHALDEKIQVDVYLPGCPPHPDQVFHTLTALLEGRPIHGNPRSVCDECPTAREGRERMERLRRFLQPPRYGAPDEALGKMRCFLEQGLLCMGPVTRSGCGGDGGIPRCIRARVPCRGCSGPVRQDGNQLLDMLNGLASNGIDIGSLPEHASLLRFSGAHRLLRPNHKRKDA